MADSQRIDRVLDDIDSLIHSHQQQGEPPVPVQQPVQQATQPPVQQSAQPPAQPPVQQAMQQPVQPQPMQQQPVQQPYPQMYQPQPQTSRAQLDHILNQYRMNNTAFDSSSVVHNNSVLDKELADLNKWIEEKDKEKEKVTKQEPIVVEKPDRTTTFIVSALTGLLMYFFTKKQQDKKPEPDYERF